MADFESALREVKPAFGAVTDTLEAFRSNGMISSGPRMQQLTATCRTLVSRVSPALLGLCCHTVEVFCKNHMFPLCLAVHMQVITLKHLCCC